MFIFSQSYVFSEKLTKSTGAVHGFSKRALGDMRNSDRQAEFLDELAPEKRLYLVHQVHGDTVAEPGGDTDTRTEADAIVLSRKDPSSRSTAIGVLTADCVPIILADSAGTCVSVVHAGWKGTLKGIIRRALDRMREKGARTALIYAAIGPRIGACCYSIPSDRADLFRDAFHADERICSRVNGTWYADIGRANVQILTECGVPEGQIDAVPMCTSCQVGSYYSFRKDTKATFGEQAAVVAFRT